MCFCLVFLTGVNFIFYNPSINTSLTIEQKAGTEEEVPPTPVEEKTASGSVNILEELLHENHFPKIMSYLDALSIHQVHEAAKLTAVHFELISPPPDMPSC